MKEADIQKTILEYLQWQVPGYFFRQNTGASVSEYKGKKRFIRYRVAGMSDILGIWHDKPQGIGIFIAIEVKKPGKKATVLQQEFIDKINNFGGRAIVADCLEDVIEMFKTN